MSDNNSTETKYKSGLPIAAVIFTTIFYKILLSVLIWLSVSRKYAPPLAGFIALFAVYPVIKRFANGYRFTIFKWVLICLATAALIFIVGVIFDL